MNQAVYVADTHALVFYLDDDARLGARARQAFMDAEAGTARIVVPMIVLAELAWIAERGRIGLNIQDVLQGLSEHPAFELAPLDEERIRAFVQLTSVPEMHDRLIATEARLRNATLLTRDAELTASGVVPVLW